MITEELLPKNKRLDRNQINELQGYRLPGFCSLLAAPLPELLVKYHTAFIAAEEFIVERDVNNVRSLEIQLDMKKEELRREKEKYEQLIEELKGFKAYLPVSFVRYHNL